MSIRPVAVGLVLCELAIVDDKTRNVTAVSCFSDRVIEVPPEFMPPFYVIATLVNGHGTVPIRLAIERLDTLDLTYDRVFPFRFPDSLKEVIGIFRIRAGAIPIYGHYQALLSVHGELLAQKRFSITSKEMDS